jgi:hypothetical protein
MTVTQPALFFPLQAPLVGGELWAGVMARADGRCECPGKDYCEGSCKKPAPVRKKGETPPVWDGRCLRVHQAHRHLLLVPRGQATGIAAMRLGADELIALCRPCAEGRQRGRNRVAKAGAEAIRAESPVLFP